MLSICDVSWNIYICQRQTNKYENENELHIKYSITINTQYGYVTPERMCHDDDLTVG